MAIQIIQQPDGVDLGYHQINSCPMFIVSLDDVGDGETYSRRLQYQLFCADGTPATKKKGFAPLRANQEFRIDFIREHRNFICSVLPDIECMYDSTFGDINKMKKRFFVRFTEIEYDLVNCTDPVEVDTKDSEPYSVINSARQWWESGSYKVGQPFLAGERSVKILLHNKPSCISICKDGKDFLYICSPSQVNITQTVQFTDGTTEDFTSQVQEGYVCVGPGSIYEFGAPSNVEGIQVTITSGLAFSRVIDYNIKKCCDTNNVVYFQESSGGFSGMFFCELQNVTTNPESEEHCDYNDRRKALDGSIDLKQYRAINSGNFIQQRSTTEQVSLLLKTPDNSDEWRRYLSEFKASQNYFIVQTNDLEEKMLVKFIVDESQILTLSNEGDLLLSVTGRIEQSFYQPISDF